MISQIEHMGNVQGRPNMVCTKFGEDGVKYVSLAKNCKLKKVFFYANGRGLYQQH